MFLKSTEMDIEFVERSQKGTERGANSHLGKGIDMSCHNLVFEMM